MVKIKGINKVDKNIKVDNIQESLNKHDSEVDVMLDNGVWYSDKDDNEFDTIQEQRIF